MLNFMKMQKIICLIGIVLLTTSCLDWDNYDEPNETLRGKITVAGTGEPFQTEISPNGVRIRLLEYSWSESPQPYDFFAKQDGSFNNEKLFEGDYGILFEGAFVPLEEYRTEIAGVTELDVEVEPFLYIELIGDPVVEEGAFSVDYRITRGTDNEDHQAELSDIWLFINTSSEFVGDNNFDRSISQRIRRPGEDELNEISTFEVDGLEGNRTYYYRVGARTNETVAGTRRYNYSEPRSVVVPAPADQEE
jgi:hypothetical protein